MSKYQKIEKEKNYQNAIYGKIFFKICYYFT